jgi:hypothetical protein
MDTVNEDTVNEYEGPTARFNKQILSLYKDRREQTRQKIERSEDIDIRDPWMDSATGGSETIC